jgi:hypothetical protein
LVANPVEIETLHRAAIDRTAPNGRPFHPRQFHIDPVNGFAGDLRWHIEILLLGSHQRPFPRSLDADPLGMGMGCLRRQRGNLAIGGGTAGREMGDDAVGRTHLFDRHAPGFGGRQQQALTRFGAGKLKIIAAVLDRRSRVGPHATVKAVRDTFNAGSAALPELRLAAA